MPGRASCSMNVLGLLRLERLAMGVGMQQAKRHFALAHAGSLECCCLGCVGFGKHNHIVRESGIGKSRLLLSDGRNFYHLRRLVRVQAARKSSFSLTPRPTRLILPSLAKDSAILSRNAFSSFVMGSSSSLPTRVSASLPPLSRVSKKLVL